MGFAWLRDKAQMTNARPTRIPLVIYVLWHPAFTDGPKLAREIAEWCGGATTDIRAAGMGIPVYFRSQPWTGNDALDPDEVPPAGQVFRRPIDIGDCSHNIFVPLVDDHMVDDPSWRRDLIELARRHREDVDECRQVRKTRRNAELDVQLHLAPIQVSSAWSRLPPIVSGIQTLFLKRWDDKPDEPTDARVPRWRIRIRRLLTQTIVRLLREATQSLLPTQIFLSHAKADRELGPGVAERIRDIAAGYGQIEVFYDENDLPSGSIWEPRLLGAARSGAGFVAVLSDAYASRYWCRREIQLARTPEPLRALRGDTIEASDLPEDKLADEYVWRVRPTVVTVTMEGKWSRLLGDAASVPAIRWRAEEQHATAILDQVFREALISEFQVRYAKMLHAHLTALGPGRPLAYVTWNLDSTTLLRLAGELRPRFANGGIVVYPGQGLLPSEEAELTAALGPDVVFVSFEQFSDLVVADKHEWTAFVKRVKPPETPVKAPPLSACPIVALSAGDADNLATFGYDDADGGSSMHVDSAVLRVARTLLQGKVRLAYGGVLRPEPNFMALLHDIVVGLAPPPAMSSTHAESDPATPLECWIARPYADRFPVATRAAHFGLCRYELVGEAAAPGATNVQAGIAKSRSLSAMREGLARRAHATFALAGKRWGFDGVMPGVAEEILARWESSSGDVRMILMGDFGGVVGEIARYILGRTATLHPSLTLAGQVANDDHRFRLLMTDEKEKARAVERYAALAKCLDDLRAIARGRDTTPLPSLGITVGEWKHVMRTTSTGYVRRLLRDKVIPALLRSPNARSVGEGGGVRGRASAARRARTSGDRDVARADAQRTRKRPRVRRARKSARKAR